MLTNIFNSIKRKLSKKQLEMSYEQLEKLGFIELKKYALDVAQANDTITADSIVQLSRRLLELAYLDEDVDIADRNDALELEGALWGLLTRSKQTHEAFASLVAARESLIKLGVECGVNSFSKYLLSLPTNEVVTAMTGGIGR